MIGGSKDEPSSANGDPEENTRIELAGVFDGRKNEEPPNSDESFSP